MSTFLWKKSWVMLAPQIPNKYNGWIMKFFCGSYTKLGGKGIIFGEIKGNIIKSNGSYFLPDPIYLILNKNRDRLYSVSGNDNGTGGSIDSFAVEDEKLRLLSRENTIGKEPCHLCFDNDGKFIYTANYTSGSVSVFPVTENGTGAMIQHVCHEGKGPDPARQKGPHIHHVSFIPGTNILCCVDLGIDALMMYKQNPETGHLTFHDRFDTPPGLGPRHIVYAANDMAYLNFEMGNQIGVLRYRAGKWESMQMISTLPPSYNGKSITAAIRLNHDGKLLLVSNRGHDSITVCNVLDDGLLSLRGIHKTSGHIPRDFIFIDEKTLLIPHQDSNLDISRFDPDTGITKTGELPLKGTVCVCF